MRAGDREQIRGNVTGRPMTDPEMGLIHFLQHHLSVLKRSSVGWPDLKRRW